MEDSDGNGAKQQINLLKVSLTILMLGNNPLVPELIAGRSLQFVCWVVVWILKETDLIVQ